jgi:uncharacterized protein YecE (DUF72 family)
VRLASARPKNAHFGTSSWSFPGWAGIVYAYGEYTATALARHGLATYARHPLLNGVGLDRTFYSPVPAAELARYAQAVPEDFRFVVKAYSALTTDPDSGRGTRMAAEPVFLDARFAAREVIAPMVEGLGAKLGAVLLQFSPLSNAYRRSPVGFAERLGEFLRGLPQGVPYAVEVRDPEILGAAYEEALRSARASHCASVHSRMPPVDEQAVGSEEAPQVIRWLLHAGYDYESAGRHYAPFNRLADPDAGTRGRVVNLISAGMRRGREVHVIAANNAARSAPLTLIELAKAFAGSYPQPC